MLILEGADLVGKTTLCRDLLTWSYFKDRGYIYSHFSRLPARFPRVWGHIEHAHRFTIQDRFHLGDPLYTQARQDDAFCLGPEQYRIVDGYLRFLGAYTIIITAPDALIIRRLEESGRLEMYDPHTILRANALYKSVVEHGSLGDYKIDWDYHIHVTDTIPSHKVKEAINEYQKRQSIVDAITQQRSMSIID